MPSFKIVGLLLLEYTILKLFLGPVTLTIYRIHMLITRSFFCSNCGVLNLVRILYKNTKFQTFFCKIRRSRKPMTIAKMIDNVFQTAYKCQTMRENIKVG